MKLGVLTPEVFSEFIRKIDSGTRMVNPRRFETWIAVDVDGRILGEYIDHLDDPRVAEIRWGYRL